MFLILAGDASPGAGSDQGFGWHQQPRPQGFRLLVGEPDPFGEHPRGKPYHAELSLSGFGSEAELVARVLERLAPWFAIEREVAGRHCSGRRLRIDAIIRPRGASSWRNPSVALGLEFKVPDGSIHSYTGWIAQAVSYTHVDWNGYGRLVILTCPGAASWLDSSGKFDSTTAPNVMIAKRLVGQLGVGELVLRWAYGLTILVNGEHIWSERYGVSRGKTWSLRVKSGNR